MSSTTIGFIGLGCLVIGLLSGMSVAFAMAAVGFVGFSYLISFNGGLNLIATDLFATFSSYSLTVVPMFVLMGSIAFASGASGRLYDTAYRFLGKSLSDSQHGVSFSYLIFFSAFPVKPI